jgi:hypothetical protein
MTAAAIAWAGLHFRLAQKAAVVPRFDGAVRKSLVEAEPGVAARTAVMRPTDPVVVVAAVAAAARRRQSPSQQVGVHLLVGMTWVHVA